MQHFIEIFTGGCNLCMELKDAVELGRCAGCTFQEHDLVKDEEARKKAAEYGIKVVPTLVIDSTIKIEGKPDFPFVCSEDFYEFLKERYGEKSA